MNQLRHFLTPSSHRNVVREVSLRLCSTTLEEPPDQVEQPPRQKKPKKEISPEVKKSHKHKIDDLFKRKPHLEAVRPHIPEKHLALKRVTPPENLYLIDEQIAKKATKYILPKVKNKDQIICETNAGLGLIAEELLENGIKLVRLYESCPEFKIYLKSKFESYEGRVELFTKDIFLLRRYQYIDKQDSGDRVQQLLKGVPSKNWEDDPVMTIIGPLPNMTFIRFLIKSLALQSFVTSLGRFQFFTFMRPREFIILTAGPHLNLHTYQPLSILFQLLFDFQLLEKFPKEVFLPWQSPRSSQSGRYPGQVDPDLMYFVRINFKRALPVEKSNLLPLYYFVHHFFKRGRNRIIPSLEESFPGCGLHLMLPELRHESYFKDLNIFTIFGELTPQQVLAVFKETINHPGFERENFMSRIESELIPSETIESNINEHLEKNVQSSETELVDTQLQ